MHRHELKTWPKFFEAVLSGRKRYEIRVNDRDFKEGDELFLREYDPETGKYSGRYIVASVSFMTRGGEWGLPQNLCVMSLRIEYWDIGAAA